MATGLFPASDTEKQQAERRLTLALAEEEHARRTHALTASVWKTAKGDLAAALAGWRKLQDDPEAPPPEVGGE